MTIEPRKALLLPLGMMDPSVDSLLGEEVDLLYCFDDEDRRELLSETPNTERVAEAREQLHQRLEMLLPEAHGLYAMGVLEALHVTAQMMDQGPKLEVIGGPGSGTEFVDADAATERGIAVVNAAGSGYIPVSEHVLGLMLSLSRGIIGSDRFLRRERRWPNSLAEPRTGGPLDVGEDVLDGKTIGILGLGFIGREIAFKCRAAFNMRVLGFDPFFDPIEAERQGITMKATLIEMIPECDFVSVNLPLNPRTRHIIGATELHAMKPAAYLINTSRGPTVDQEALLEALRENRIAGAGLDVFDPEPLPDNHPLFVLENVVLTPHTAGRTVGILNRLSRATATEMLVVLKGERPWHLVNPEVLPRLAQAGKAQ
jgi:D-3-phosphoglycerate dehydrogenase